MFIKHAKGERKNEYGISEHSLEFGATDYYSPINPNSDFVN